LKYNPPRGQVPRGGTRLCDDRYLFAPFEGHARRSETMNKRTYLLCALGLGFAAMAQPIAAEEADDAKAESICLRSNDINNWEAENGRTLIVTDRRDRQYRLGLVGACTGIGNAQFQLGFETFTELSCLRPGDAIHYRDPAFGHERCVISSVEAYTPPPADGAQDEG